MILDFKYTELVKILTEVATVIDDSLANEDMKYIIFEVKNGTLQIITTSNLIIYKQYVSKDIYTLQINDSEYIKDDITNCNVFRFQLKSKELLSFLGTYKSMRRTKARNVTFTTLEKMRVKCEVTEEIMPMKSMPKDVSSASYMENEVVGFLAESNEIQEEDEIKGQLVKSTWVFITNPIKLNIINNINTTYDKTDASLTDIDTNLLAYYTKNMLNAIKSKASNLEYVIFDKEYILGVNQKHTTVMKNKINENGIFSDLKLSYKVTQFLDKVVTKQTNVKVLQNKPYLCFFTDTSESYVIYDTKLPQYRPYIDLYKQDYYITLDKLYMKDILKRLSLAKDEPIVLEVDAPNNRVLVSNTKYSQEIGIDYNYNMPDRHFKVSIQPEILTKAISCTNYGETNNELRIYYCVSANTNILAFADGEDLWYTVVKIAFY